MDYQIQVITVPVTDVDQAAAFYTQQAGLTRNAVITPASPTSPTQTATPGSSRRSATALSCLI